MPWKEQTMSEQRRAFVSEVKAGIETKTALCARYRISRPTGDKWIHRYDEGESMENRSRRPVNSPSQTDATMEEEILSMREAYPSLGARKIKRRLENQGKSPPGHSTVHAILKRNGCVSEEASKAVKPYQRFERSAPNELWQTDFKGHFTMGNGKECHPLNILDDHSRYCLELDAKENEQLSSTWITFQSAFRTYGLPDAILCDNGNPWGTNFRQGYTQFERMLLDQDIRPIHGRPRHPQTQGKDERFNQTLKKECLKGKAFDDIDAVQSELKRFRSFYNEERPHHALRLDSPSIRYEVSGRPYIERVSAFVYPEGGLVRRIHKGHVRYLGGYFFVSHAFEGAQVLVRPIEGGEEDGTVEVLYRNWRIAHINLLTGEVSCRLKKASFLHD